MNIYSNRRSLLKSGVLKRDILMDEFEKKLLQIKSIFLTDITIRSEIMRKACNFIEYDKLEMEDSDLKFLSNYQLLIEFFQEICVENVSLNKLSKFDLYKKYTVHVDVLNHIFVNYLTIMSSENMDDLITISNRWWTSNKKIPTINMEWIKNADSFHFFYDGILSRFDKTLIEAVASIKKENRCILYTHLDSWFEKSISRLDDFGDLEENTIYRFDFYTKKAEKVADFKLKYNIEVNSVVLESMYGLYIDKKIEEMNNAGIKSSDIGVVCASNSIFKDLEIFNSNKIFFQKSKPLSEMNSMRTIKIIIDIIKKNQIDNFKNKKTNSPELKVLARYIKFEYIRREDVLSIFKEYEKSNSLLFISNLIQKLYIFSNEKEERDLLGELHEKIVLYSKILQDMKNKYIFEIILQMSSDIYLEQKNNQNLVEVVDFINSRGFSKKYLIILGFENNNVPMDIKKDRFLDSSIRNETGMPNYKDRIAMQYHYWQTLIGKSVETFICYHSDNETEVANLADILGVQLFKEIPVEPLFQGVFEKNMNLTIDGLDSDISYNVFPGRILSPSKLKTYLGCKRKYYLKYLRKIKEPIVSDFKNEKRQIGTIVHKIIEEVLINVKNEELSFIQNKAIVMLKELLPNTITYEYNFQYWSEKLNNFLAMEYLEIKNGGNIIASEKSLNFTYNGIVLQGVIDRIDEGVNNSIIISDYKTGKTPKLRSTGKGETDFQAEFYKFLVENNFKNVDSINFEYRNIKDCYILPVKTSPAREKAFFEALNSFINDDGKYDKTTNINECMFCPYKDMCNK